ncbi:ComF family protein [Candidatus Uhrbacteria bacterium]|nr:ComF family protein [Candidatus Uhrbacteria bacterium]
MCTRCLNGISFRIPTRELEAIDSVTTIGPYADPALRALITGFKYQSATCLEDAFTQLLRRFFDDKKPAWVSAGVVLIPVPSSEHRILERGFDHVQALANIVGEGTGTPSSNRILKRRRQTLSNADLQNEDARRGNVHGAFEIIGKAPESVLLVDDVVTSGATAVECAKLLKNHGAKQVYLFTWANGG